MPNDYHNRAVQFLRLIKTFLKRVWEIMVRKEVLYVQDLTTMDADSGLILNGISVECYTKPSDIPADDIELLKRFKTKEMVMAYFAEGFDRGSCLWLAKKDGRVVSRVWTIIGGAKVNGFYCGHPILSNDAIIMAGETFFEFRGRRYMAAMRRLVCEKLRDAGVTRVYSAAHIRNKAAQRSQAKSATRIGVTRHLRFFKWYIVLWCKDS